MIERFRQYVLFDHKARWRNDMFCVILAVCFYLFSLNQGVEDASAVKAGMAFLVSALIGSTLWYVVKPQRLASRINIDLSRRALVPRLVSFLVVLFFGLGTPSLEAAFVDRRLRKAIQGEPTRDKIEEAGQIVAEANEHNLHASPQLISQIGAEVLNSSTKPSLRESAWNAALQFASYRSALAPRPQVQPSTTVVPGSTSIKISCETSLPEFTVSVKGLQEKEAAAPTQSLAALVDSRALSFLGVPT
jgi:hypothetical protein